MKKSTNACVCENASISGAKGVNGRLFTKILHHARKFPNTFLHAIHIGSLIKDNNSPYKDGFGLPQFEISEIPGTSFQLLRECIWLFNRHMCGALHIAKDETYGLSVTVSDVRGVQDTCIDAERLEIHVDVGLSHII
jgi:hypothetical protein